MWTDPTPRSAGFFVTASVWNTDIVDNLKHLVNPSGNLNLVSAGPHSLGTVVLSNAFFTIGGAFSGSAGATTVGMFVNPDLTVAFQQYGAVAVLGGTLRESGSSVHPLFSTLALNPPTIINGGATTTIGTTLWLTGAPSVATYVCAALIDNGNVYLRSSDVAHGMTDVAPDQAYGGLMMASTLIGGTCIRGLTEGVIGLTLKGHGTSEDTLSTSAATGAIQVEASKKNGTGLTQYGTTANIFVVRNEGGGARFIVKGDGNLYADGTLTTYFAAPNGDRYDDAMLALAWESTLNDDPRLAEVQRTHGRYFTDDLVAAGIIAEKDPATGRHFLNLTAMAKLSLGAAWQTALALKSLTQRLELLEEQQHG